MIDLSYLTNSPNNELRQNIYYSLNYPICLILSTKRVLKESLLQVAVNPVFSNSKPIKNWFLNLTTQIWSNNASNEHITQLKLDHLDKWKHVTLHITHDQHTKEIWLVSFIHGCTRDFCQMQLNHFFFF